MRGRIASRQKCGACGLVGNYHLQGSGPNAALVCSCGRFIATSLFVYIKWRGTPLRIHYNQHGLPLGLYADALAAQVEIDRQINHGTFNPDLWKPTKSNKYLWQNYRKSYLQREKQRAEAGRISWGTYRKRKALSKHMIFLDGLTIHEIRAAQLEDFAHQDLGLAPKTMADLVAEVGRILKTAVKREELATAPPIPTIKVPRKAPDWLTAKQQLEVLEHIDPAHRPIILFMMEYGCRVGEACGLTWEHVDLRKGEFTFANTKERKEKTLPIVGWFADHLATIPIGIGPTPVFKNPEARFHRNEHGVYSDDFVRSRWNAAVKAAGYPPLCLKNGTRHSKGNQARQAGWDEGDIARLLGHATTTPTRRFYLDNDTGPLRRLMEGSPKVAN